MKKTLLAFITLTIWSALALAQTPPLVTVLKGFDPVELTEGREVKGLETVTVVRGKYRYLFANAANKRLFERKPAVFQIQLGGGCGRMGSLSGEGSPERYYVFDKRIYIFASEQCRNSFKSAPEQHVEAPDASPTGTADEKQRGQALLQRALTALGGAPKVDAVKTYQAQIKLVYKQGDKVSEYKQTKTLAFPGRYRDEYDWGSSVTGDILSAEGAVSFDRKGAWQREEPVRAALERQFYREPMAILKARRANDFVAVAAGQGKVGETAVEFLKVGVKGAASTLALDAQTGRILQIAYRDRKNAYGDLVKTFSDFREVDGLTLPFKVTESFNGKPLTSPQVSYEMVTINGKLDAQLFQQPQSQAGVK